jgi:N6-adenosine-specific RNA methylase IME4
LLPVSKEIGGFGAIVMDPPWENRSANRSKAYMTLPNYSLFKLPLNDLMSKDGCLVAMWVTNSEKYFSFIKEKYFPHFGIKYLATWYWLKVTQAVAQVNSR